MSWHLDCLSWEFVTSPRASIHSHRCLSNRAARCLYIMERNWMELFLQKSRLERNRDWRFFSSLRFKRIYRWVGNPIFDPNSRHKGLLGRCAEKPSHGLFEMLRISTHGNIYCISKSLFRWWFLNVMMTEETDIAAEMKEDTMMVVANNKEFTMLVANNNNNNTGRAK